MTFLRYLLISVVLTLVAFSAVAESVDINTASAEELSAGLKGVGPKRAEAIVAYRDEHGSFQSVDELSKVSGIGKKLLEANRENLKVGEVTETVVQNTEITQ